MTMPDNQVIDVYPKLDKIEESASENPYLPHGPVEFEEAIQEAGFGIFNIFLLLVMVPCLIATYFASSTMAYVISSAECDLHLSLEDKGLLNAIPYAGMIVSAILWGVIADTKGRRKALIVGFLLDVVCVFAQACSQKAYQLMIFKFLGGFIMSGAYPIIMAYLSELHGKTYRPQVMMVTGTIYAFAAIILPLMAIGILPLQFNLKFLGLQIHPWQMFLVATASTSLMGGVFLSFFPESPKFLMSQGRCDEALKIFQQIYAVNTRKPKDTYPVVSLVNELQRRKSRRISIFTVPTSDDGTPDKTVKAKNLLQQTWEQSRPLFIKPYVRFSSQIFFMCFLILFGQNTIRLWVPQLFASLEEYAMLKGEITDICSIIQYGVNKTQIILDEVTHRCEVVATVESYSNNIIVGGLNLLGYLIVSYAVKFMDVKLISNFGLLLAAVCGAYLYFSASIFSTVIASGLYTTAGSISITALSSASVNIFPTTLRSLVISLSMMFGRLGSLFGNMLFPKFMIIGCIPPFVMISLVMLIAFILALFLPNTNKLSLK